MARRNKQKKDDLYDMTQKCLQSILYYSPISETNLNTILMAFSSYCYSCGHEDGYDEGILDGKNGVDKRISTVNLN